MKKVIEMYFFETGERPSFEETGLYLILEDGTILRHIIDNAEFTFKKVNRLPILVNGCPQG